MSDKLLLDAIHFACLKHSTQRRKDGAETPYINHPIGVAHILMFEGNVTDIDIVIAAILHDTIEDTDTSVDEIISRFGQRIANIVLEVTDDKNLPKAERKLKQIESAPKKSNEAKQVKIADKIYNLRDINRVRPVGWSLERCQEYFDWGHKVLNGCKGVNEQLDLIASRLTFTNKS
ncbi:HD domain-containing protein 3 [Globomyces pollinis-pini]|nr:HD domain-containing protein 3 [Globomyces pollinis-pini]